jgi:RNA polymerase sigma-70 factor (ECF subfamily)
MTIEEYNRCVHDLADGLYRFALKASGSKAVADDFVQDAFERLWKKVDVIDFNKAKAYLFKTVVNLQIDAARRLKLKNIYVSSINNPIAEENAPFDLKMKLDEGVRMLSDVQKNCLLLRDYEGYSYQEIADILSITDDQVKINIFRARKFLKSFIGKIEVLV